MAGMSFTAGLGHLSQIFFLFLGLLSSARTQGYVQLYYIGLVISGTMQQTNLDDYFELEVEVSWAKPSSAQSDSQSVLGEYNGSALGTTWYQGYNHNLMHTMQGLIPL